jgi:hypothetical protein
MTILILYDRINAVWLKPQIFKPYLGENFTERNVRRSSAGTFTSSEKARFDRFEAERELKEAKLRELDVKYQLTLPSLDKKPEEEVPTNGIMDVRRIMEKRVDSIKINKFAQFGSRNLVIRSNEIVNDQVSGMSSDSGTEINSRFCDDEIETKYTNVNSNKVKPKILTSDLSGALPAVASKYKQPLLSVTGKPKLAASSTFNKATSRTSIGSCSTTRPVFNIANLIRERKNSRQNLNSVSGGSVKNNKLGSQSVNYFSYNKDYYNNYDKFSGAGSHQIASILNFKPKMNLLFSGVEENKINASRLQQQQQQQMSKSYKDAFQLPNLIEETNRNNHQKYLRNKMI